MAVSAIGGTMRTIVSDSVTAFGGSWGNDGNIYFTHSRGGIARVSEKGGVVSRISKPDSAAGEQEHDFIQVLPGAKGGILQIWRGSPSATAIDTLSFATGKTKQIAKGTFARFLPPDKVIFATADGRLFALPFDEKSLSPTGEPV